VSDAWTVRKVVAWTRDDFAARGIPSPRLDAELIVAHALSIDRVKLYLDLDRPLLPGELDIIRGLVARRRQREPIAYILGRREFYGREMIVTPDVLIPRPDTETLIEQALALLPADEDVRILDLCTGSGCIVVTLLAERARAQAVATDLSTAALEIARKNAAKHSVADRVTWGEGDLYAALETTEAFDLVVANPPYLASSERAGLEPDVRDHEPGIALFAPGADGLDLVRGIVAGVEARLRSGGSLLVEIGATQGPAAAAIFAEAGLEDVSVVRDLGDRDRVVRGRRRLA
jgi:release factor glutamine methyltransferase